MAETQAPAAPEDTITITFAGKPREVTMSFGLLHEITKVVPDLAEINMLLISAELRGKTLAIIFATRDERGRVVEEMDPYTLPISTSEARKLLLWVMDHLLSFFLAALEGAMVVTQPYGPLMGKVLTPLSDGSPG